MIVISLNPRKVTSTFFALIIGAVMAFGVTGCKGKRAIQEPDTCIDESKIDPNGACYKIYRPVCGCDGVTYSNDCMAEKAGVTSYTEGNCK